VIDQFDLPKDTVNDMFQGYVSGALLEDLDLPSGIESLIRDLVLEIADANWSNLVDPDALYDVTSQHVSYLSRHPDGSPSSELTAAITFPAIASASDFVTRDRVIILTHATGSTPSDLDNTDAWYILANLFASRGYLVIAPDNYGRGGTLSAPETYLMATRTALNTLDLVNQVFDDMAYDDVYNGSELAIIGYSQGGHSAIGLHLLLETQGPDNLSIREVYSGGAPHNLYQTVRGVIQHLDGSCDDGAYCRYVDEETTVPFATDRIFPGFLNYTDTGLSLDDVVTSEKINPAFVTAFLADDPTLDSFKAMLQLSSFTQILSTEDNLEGSTARVHLYHSEFDRLVPFANTSELAAILEPTVTLDFHENRCNSAGYEAIFNLTDKVGVLHTLCGLSVLDEALADFK
jgi:pimeloyl-ACP methyl ester carboxylesterase